MSPVVIAFKDLINLSAGRLRRHPPPPGFAAVKSLTGWIKRSASGDRPLRHLFRMTGWHMGQFAARIELGIR